MNKIMKKHKIYRLCRNTGIITAVIFCLIFSGCAAPTTQTTPVPTPAKSTAPSATSKPSITVPEKLGAKAGEEPMLKVYVVEDKAVELIPLEDYLLGVLAGEMKNDWPMEALKAQAILARTFVLKFVEEKTSMYPEAHISTDIKEAQAYNSADVNERIKTAVKETRGIVMSYNGTLPYSWFHAHSGGITEKAKEGLEFEKAEPGYTKVVQSTESKDAPPQDASWTASFTVEEVVAAINGMGFKIDDISSIEIAKKGESGRATLFLINGQHTVSAPSLRLALDSLKLKSMLLSDVSLSEDRVTFKGKGYGHGVGMSQWGAYQMANEGKKAEDIISHYFNGIKLENIWE